MASRKKPSQHAAAEHARREQALDVALEDSFPASDPVAAAQPAPSADDQGAPAHQVTRHDKSDVVELSDGSCWRIWPEDLRNALGWQPATALRVVETDHRFCSHALVNPADRSRTRAIAHRAWPVEEVRKSLKNG